jgi:hypothetical protein
LLNAIGVPSGTASAYKSATNWAAYADKIFAIDGTCGTGVYYAYNSTSETLNIFGSGAMKDYPRDPEELPWNSYGGMSTVVIGNGVTHIGNNAFHGCGSLASITIPNSVTSIGGDAFMSCSSLASIEIPASVTSIGNSAFERCDGLTSVTFGNSVTSIGGDAFMNCSSLASIEIPASVTSIGDRAFESCFSLASISVASGNTKYHSEGNCLIETATKTLIRGCKTSVIPTGVTSIGECAFNGCSALTNIEIPDDVTSIGDDAFSGCTGLTSVTFGNSVTSIGDYAFNGCNALTSIEIPASVTSIGDGAFYSCSSLASITIYAPSLTTYVIDAFGENAAGRKIYVFSDCVETYKAKASIMGVSNSDYIVPIPDVTVSGVTANEASTASWCTYYHPAANVKINTTGVEIYKGALNGLQLDLTKVDGNVIKAGQAVILKASAAGTLDMELTSSTPTGDFSDNDLKGGTTVASGYEAYTLSRGADGTDVLGFYKFTGSLDGNKAHLELPINSSARGYIGFGEDGETGIEAVQTTPDPSSLRRGNEDTWYSLDGRKMQGQPTKKGIYVRNGQKYIVK